MNIGGLIFTGQVANDRFAMQAVRPTERFVQVAPRQTHDPKHFWITDPDINLRGMYGRLNDGRIIRITDQDGTRCTMQLIRKKDTKRFKQQTITDAQIEEIKKRTEMGDYLDGTETQQEILNIAGGFPADLSREAWSKLRGNVA